MRKFKIFYSWQSDLPGNKTRNFIRECIDEAIELAHESETIEAERDEATTGTTGSPNIVTTLFSKIDDCDLFIADLSLCFTEEQKTEKRSPNPNVMLELGYAVKTLGWERVICLCNVDFGDKYPFDVAHNRITNFSLDGKSKKEVKAEIAKIIFINIRELRNINPRAKTGLATHVIGAYDSQNHRVIHDLIPVDIGTQESYRLHNDELLNNARKLFAEIQELTNKINAVSIEEDERQVALPKHQEPLVKSPIPDAIRSLVESYNASETPVIWEDVEDDKLRIKHWLGFDVSDEFFDMGKLKRVVQLLDRHSPHFNGTDDEKAKYEKLHMLSYTLSRLDIRTNYLKTFNGMYFIPLAIQNVSSMQDANIHVVINVEVGEIIEPDEHLIWEEYEGLQGILCRDDDDETDVGVICELFSLDEDGIIHVENASEDPSRYIPKSLIMTSDGFKQPDKTEEDYKLELEEFIASTEGRGYYEFDVDSLRPNECRWLCCGMLIRAFEGKIKVHYQIYSTNSGGDLSGILEIKD